MRLHFRLTVLLSFSCFACSGTGDEQSENGSEGTPEVPELTARGVEATPSDLEFTETYSCTPSLQEGLIGGGSSNEEGRCMEYRVCDGGYNVMIECQDYRCTCTFNEEPVATFNLLGECPGEEGPDHLLGLCPFGISRPN